MKGPSLALVRVNDRSGAHPFLTEANVTGMYPPLGLAYIAAAVRDAGFPVKIVDAHVENLSHREVVDAVRGADAVGLAATTFNWPIAAETVRAIRQASPSAYLFAGGPQTSLYAQECLEAAPVDGVVVGEGEQAVPAILEQIGDGNRPDAIPGLIARLDGSIVRGPDPLPIRDLDSVPMPALDLLPLRRYRALTVAHPFVSMVTSRGCPYRCRYCSQVYAGGVYREHSAGRVVEEMDRAVRRFGAREIILFDETFTVGRERVFAVCDGIDERRLRVRWNIRTRADRLDDELLARLARTGCVCVHVGVEAGTKRVQELMAKNLDLDRVARVLAGARRAGIETRGYFMIGFPGETAEEIDQTLRLARALRLDWASFTITTPNPGTDIYREAVADGRFPIDFWREYTLGRAIEAPAFFRSSDLDPDLLERRLRAAYRRFYLRPGLLLRKLLSVRFWRTAPGALLTYLAIRARARRHGAQ